jgi:hypothetical protein
LHSNTFTWHIAIPLLDKYICSNTFTWYIEILLLDTQQYFCIPVDWQTCRHLVSRAFWPERCNHNFKNRPGSWDQCYDFLNIFAEKFSKKLVLLAQNKAKLWKKLIITLVFGVIVYKKYTNVMIKFFHKNRHELSSRFSEF